MFGCRFLNLLFLFFSLIFFFPLAIRNINFTGYCSKSEWHPMYNMNLAKTIQYTCFPPCTRTTLIVTHWLSKLRKKTTRVKKEAPRCYNKIKASQKWNMGCHQQSLFSLIILGSLFPFFFPPHLFTEDQCNYINNCWFTESVDQGTYLLSGTIITSAFLDDIFPHKFVLSQTKNRKQLEQKKLSHLVVSWYDQSIKQK